MAAISGISSASAVQQILQTQQSVAQQKPAPAQVQQDTVHLSKAALSALGSGSGDADHDGDSH